MIWERCSLAAGLEGTSVPFNFFLQFFSPPNKTGWGGGGGGRGRPDWLDVLADDAELLKIRIIGFSP